MPRIPTVISQQRAGGRATTVPPVPGHLVVQYHGIDRCDGCGQPLEKGQSLSGLCKACEEARKVPKGPAETVIPKRGLL